MRFRGFRQAMCADSAKVEGPELVIGLVAAIGTDLGPVSAAIEKSLKAVNYACDSIRLSQLLDDVQNSIGVRLVERPEDRRYHSHMDAGNELRKKLQRGDALAAIAIGAIREVRKNCGSEDAPLPRHAYLLRSLKHPDEVSLLRRVYGPAFVLVAAYSPQSRRLQNLASRIAASYNEFHSENRLPNAQELIKRDEAETLDKFGQNVREVYPRADFFIDASDANRLEREINRVIELLFGNSFHTPTRDEYGMFHARAAALRSASLQRQVGAVVASPEGDIVAAGANEVPRAGGGLCWAGDEPDQRDFVLGEETNDRLKRRMLAEILHRLKEQKWLADDKSALDVDDLLGSALDGPLALMKDAQIMNVIEFGRCVHAEMAALLDAARRGTSVSGCTLYCTTFPCHDCARHILAAGIRRVVFVEPYPKSMVAELYPSLIAVEESTGAGGRLCFEPFVGVAPQRYMDLFAMLERKDKLGRVRKWDGPLAVPKFGEYFPATRLAALTLEQKEFGDFGRRYEELVGHKSPASNLEGGAYEVLDV